MTNKPARPMKSSEEFLLRLKALKGKLMAVGITVSLTELTRQISNEEVFKEIEKKILRSDTDLIKFDRRNR